MSVYLPAQWLDLIHPEQASKLIIEPVTGWSANIHRVSINLTPAEQLRLKESKQNEQAGLLYRLFQDYSNRQASPAVKSVIERRTYWPSQPLQEQQHQEYEKHIKGFVSYCRATNQHLLAHSSQPHAELSILERRKLLTCRLLHQQALIQAQKQEMLAIMRQISDSLDGLAQLSTAYHGLAESRQQAYNSLIQNVELRLSGLGLWTLDQTHEEGDSDGGKQEEQAEKLQTMRRIVKNGIWGLQATLKRQAQILRNSQTKQ